MNSARLVRQNGQSKCGKIAGRKQFGSAKMPLCRGVCESSALRLLKFVCQFVCPLVRGSVCGDTLYITARAVGGMLISTKHGLWKNGRVGASPLPWFYCKCLSCHDLAVVAASTKQACLITASARSRVPAWYVSAVYMFCLFNFKHQVSQRLRPAYANHTGRAAYTMAPPDALFRLVLFYIETLKPTYYVYWTR